MSDKIKSFVTIYKGLKNIPLLRHECIHNGSTKLLQPASYQI
jgi:hypothetical protein